MAPWYNPNTAKQHVEQKEVSEVSKVTTTETLRVRGPVLTGVPIRLLTALIVIAAIAIAIGLAVRGFHLMNMAGPGMSWTYQ
jgi:hypothetical protein